MVALSAVGLAHVLGPVVEPAVVQVFDPSEDARAGAAWACAFLLVWVGAHVLLRAFGLVRPTPAFPRLASRAGGALLAGFRGVLLLLLACYVVLDALVPPATARRLGAESRVVALLPPVRRRLTALLRLPEDVQRHARAIEGRLRDGG